MPSVLFINRVYPPSAGATGDLLAELAPALAAEGWQVTVLTTRPLDSNSPTRSHTVRVEHVGGLPFTRASHLRRALAYLSLYPALLWRAWRLPAHDVTVLLTDPPLVLVLGPLIGIFRRTRLVHWAQDVYPEVAEELDVLRTRGWFANGLRWIANAALRRYDRVITVGECMRAVFISRGLSPARLAMIPNWADAARIQPVPGEQNAFRREHAEPDEFVVMYSGNFGLAHTFEPVLEAAAILQHSHSQVRFLLVGAGPRFEAVNADAVKRGLKNVRFLKPVPRQQLAESLSAADVHLVTMREGLCGLVVPSKIYGVMAAGRALLFLGPSESEAALTVRRHECGWVLPPDDAPGLADAIAKLAEDSARLEAMGFRAREAAEAVGLTRAIPAFRELLSDGFMLSSGEPTDKSSGHSR